MKNTKLAIVFLLLTSAFAKAQTSIYYPFPDSNAVWNVRISGSECSQCYKRSYYLSGDTVINGSNYHKISYFEEIGISLPPWYSCAYPNGPGNLSQYLGAIRQDTSQRKVFLVIAGDSTDTLLYNFNLSIGDTLPYGYKNSSGQSVYIMSIDSILIGTNYRKRFNLGNTVSSGIIEGIGSASGLVEDLFIFECGGYLECFRQNDTTLYPFLFTQCEIADALKNISSENNSISPNPFHSTALLEIISDFNNPELKIFNAFGEQVKRQKIISRLTIINRDKLVDGIYFYQVITDKEILSSGTLMIE